MASPLYPVVRQSFILAAVAATVVLSGCNDGGKARPNFVFKDAPKPGVVANIDGQDVTEDELIASDRGTFAKIKKEEYDFRMDRLNKLLQERLIASAAKKASMSVEEYTTKKVLGGEVKVSSADFKKFVDRLVKAGRIRSEADLDADTKSKIGDFLKVQKRDEMMVAHVAKLTKASPVEVYFKKPAPLEVEVGTGPVYGKATAPVTIVEFSDFQCPYCSKGAEVVNELKKKYGNKVRIAFRHFPLPSHPQARPAAEASMCIHEQNADKFWKYHDLLFKNQQKLDEASLGEYAKQVGADTQKFDECFKSKKFAAAVQADLDYGAKVGVGSTPTFFINGQLVAGALPVENFSEMIDEEIANAKK